MDAQAVAFAIVAVVALVSGVGVVTTRNVAHAALFLLVSLASVAGVFILLVAEFLALVQVLIYGGAVTIVLLFALMLTRAEDFFRVQNNTPPPTFIIHIGEGFSRVRNDLTALGVRSALMKAFSPVWNNLTLRVVRMALVKEFSLVRNNLATVGVGSALVKEFSRGLNVLQSILQWTLVVLKALGAFILWAAAAVAALGVFGAMGTVILNDRLDTQELRGPSLQELGGELFTNWVVPFEVASLVLLMALIGAIILARASDSDEPGSGG